MEKISVGIESMLQSILLAFPRIVVGLILLAVGSYVVKLILTFIRKRFEKRDLELSLRGFLLSIIKTVLYVLLLITVAATMGIQTTVFTAAFASAGLAIGLALQGSLSNFAGGVLILLFKPFKVGDYISNSGGTEGDVEKIDLLYTTITGPTGLRIYSPNGPLANSIITNYSTITSRRHDFQVGISYNANIKEANEAILKALASESRILQTPVPIVFVNNLGDSAVVLNVRFWCEKAHYWNVVFEIQQIVKDALDQANVQIPFPQRELHIVTDKTK